MKVIVCGLFMACSACVSAAELTADSNLAIGANTILGKFERVTAVPASEVPNVDKSLAIGAASILGIFPRQTQVALGNIPSVDAAKNGFIQQVMNRQLNTGHGDPAIHARSEKAPVLN
jgi:hypothetical protein